MRLSSDVTLAAALLPGLELDDPDQIRFYNVADRKLVAATPIPIRHRIRMVHRWRSRLGPSGATRSMRASQSGAGRVSRDRAKRNLRRDDWEHDPARQSAGRYRRLARPSVNAISSHARQPPYKRLGNDSLYSCPCHSAGHWSSGDNNGLALDGRNDQNIDIK